MSGLREKTKRENQRRIIQSAKKMFLDRGIQKTSVADIARAAEVGTGTMYNYYSSKGALLLAIIAEDTAGIMEANQLACINENGALVDDIIHPLKEVMTFFEHYPKAFWREVTHVLLAEAESNSSFWKETMGLDEGIMTLIKHIIEKHENSFSVPVNPGEASTVVHSLAESELLLYIYEEGVTREQVIENLKRKIHFIFAGKLKPEEDTDKDM